MELIADVTFTTEGIVVITALLAALVGAVTVVFKLLIGSYEKRLEELKSQYAARIVDLESQRKSYKGISEEAIDALERQVANTPRAEPPQRARLLVPVVPEHNSPPTMQQTETAELQTLRARITAATLSLDLSPREAEKPEPGTDNPEAVLQHLKDKKLETEKDRPASIGDVTKVVDAIQKTADELPAKTADLVVEKLDSTKVDPE